MPSLRLLSATVCACMLALSAIGAAQTAGVVPDAGIRVSPGPADDFCRQVRLAHDAGIPWVSVGTTWAELEPAQGDYRDPETARALLTCAKDLGLNTQLIITDAPQWASGRTGSNDQPTPANVPAYGAFLTDLTPKLAPLVDVWTVWNEPNFDLFWTRPFDPAQYVAIQKAGYAAIKPLDPMSLVSSAPLVGTPTSSGMNAWDYLTGAYKAGLAGNADLVLLNFYPRTTPEGTATDSKGRPAPWALSSQPYMRGIVDTYDAGRPIWITETSYGTCTNCYGDAANSATEAQQADYIARMYSYRRRYLQGITDRIFWFETHDSGADPRSWWNSQGIYRYDWTPKPAVAALATVRVPGTTPSSPGVGVETTPTGSGTTTQPPVGEPTVPSSILTTPTPSTAVTPAGVRVSLTKLRITTRAGRITIRTRVSLSSGAARLRVEGYRNKRWRLVKVVRLPGSAAVRITMVDRGYLGLRVRVRPDSSTRWVAARVARVPLTRR